MNIPKVLGTAFFIEQFWWLLFNVLVSERILKKESGEIAFDLISLVHVQIQEPTSSHSVHPSFLQGGLSLQPNFQKGGRLDKISTFKGGLLGKRG